MTQAPVIATTPTTIKWNYETLNLSSMPLKELDAQIDEIYHRLGWSLTQAENDLITYPTYQAFEKESVAAVDAIQGEMKARNQSHSNKGQAA